MSHDRTEMNASPLAAIADGDGGVRPLPWVVTVDSGGAIQLLRYETEDAALVGYRVLLAAMDEYAGFKNDHKKLVEIDDALGRTGFGIMHVRSVRVFNDGAYRWLTAQHAAAPVSAERSDAAPIPGMNQSNIGEP